MLAAAVVVAGCATAIKYTPSAGDKTFPLTAMPDETQRVLGVAKRPFYATSSGDPEIWNLTLRAPR